MKKRRGSIPVFMVLLFSCFLIVTATLLTAARSAAERGQADAAFHLAGRSVLSEYDRKLFDDYGIMAFKGDEDEIESDIRFYAGATLDPYSLLYVPFRAWDKKDDSHSDVLNPDLQNMTVSLKGYSLLNLDNFEGQIKEAFATEWLKMHLHKKATGKKGAVQDTNRTLRNKSVIASLPSNGYESPAYPLLSNAKKLIKEGNIVQSCIGTIATDEYSLSLFTHHQNAEAPCEGHFFRNEVEYIIEGTMKDSSNYSGVKAKLVLVRFTMNCAHIWGDNKKLNLLLELSEAGGPYEGVLLGGLISGWAAAETHNDLLRLEAGEKVAFVKNSRQWALNEPVGIFKSLGDSIAEAVSGLFDYGYSSTAVEPEDKGGWTYESYLRLLLFLLDRETKLLRIQDLIQINMKGTYREDFLMREYYTGYHFDALVNGDVFHYDENY